MTSYRCDVWCARTESSPLVRWSPAALYLERRAEQLEVHGDLLECPFHLLKTLWLMRISDACTRKKRSEQTTVSVQFPSTVHQLAPLRLAHLPGFEAHVAHRLQCRASREAGLLGAPTWLHSGTRRADGKQGPAGNGVARTELGKSIESRSGEGKTVQGVFVGSASLRTMSTNVHTTATSSGKNGLAWCPSAKRWCAT